MTKYQSSMQSFIQSIEAFNSAGITTIDPEDYQRLIDLMTVAIPLAAVRKERLMGEIDKAQKTYNRWIEKKNYIQSNAHDILTMGLIPNREHYKQLMLDLPGVIKSFDELPDVYGNSWIVYGIRGKEFIGDKFHVSGLIAGLKERLNKIGLDIYPDLMF